MKKNRLAGMVVVATTLAAAVVASAAIASVSKPKAFIGRFHTITHLASMVPTKGPAKGDQNPYGVAVVKRSVGKLVKGDVLVSNFNNVKEPAGDRQEHHGGFPQRSRARVRDRPAAHFDQGGRV